MSTTPIAREPEHEFDRLNAEVARLQEQNGALRELAYVSGIESMPWREQCNQLAEQNATLQSRVSALEQEVVRLANLKNRLLGEMIREDKTFTQA